MYFYTPNAETLIFGEQHACGLFFGTIECQRYRVGQKKDKGLLQVPSEG